MTRYPLAFRVLAVVQLVVVAFVALVGSFADGGQWWDRVVLVAVHPVGAVFLVVLVMSRQPTQRLVRAAMAVLAVNVAADVVISLAISTGASRGDWWLPLVFSAIPLATLFYGLPLLRRS